MDLLVLSTKSCLSGSRLLLVQKRRSRQKNEKNFGKNRSAQGKQRKERQKGGLKKSKKSKIKRNGKIKGREGVEKCPAERKLN